MGFNKQNITLHGLLVHDDARFSVGFLCRCCMKFPDGKVFFDKRQENIREFTSVGAWNNSFSAQFAYGLTGGQSGRTNPWNHWPDQGPSNRAVIFYDAGFLAKLRSCRFVPS